ncbi:MAG: stage II sporulation protein D [Clostridiales bacterium]|nr:stage II sporulation protein D [Clostridiales bacterium]
MKRIIWASILLGLAAILMPALFLRGQVEGMYEENYEPPLPAQAQQSPAPTEEGIKTPTEGRDSQILFRLSDNGSVRETNMEEYLPYAIAAEMPLSFGFEALKAQAVAARTYVLYCMENQNPKHPDGDICTDSGCCLAYLDEGALRGAWAAEYEENLETVKAAVLATDGQVLHYENSPILACFHSSSAGKTESGSALWADVPYLISVESPEREIDVPNFVTTVEVSADDFRETVLLLRENAAFSDDPSQWLEDVLQDDSGRVKSVLIGGVSLTGQEMRSLFALRSTAFTLEYKDGVFFFTVTGYGHGLGMSQYGANVMAKNGFNYREILLHYYPDTKLS